MAIQGELKRVGCDPGAVDGAWGEHSRQALAAFGQFAHVNVGPLIPTPGILSLIRSSPGIVCPVGGPPPPPAPGPYPYRRHYYPPPYVARPYHGWGYGY